MRNIHIVTLELITDSDGLVSFKILNVKELSPSNGEANGEVEDDIQD